MVRYDPSTGFERLPLPQPTVPDELAPLMKQLAKEVLKHKPENIHEFAAQFFERLLVERDGTVDKGYDKFRDVRNYCVVAEKKDKKSTTKKKHDSVKVKPKQKRAPVVVPMQVDEAGTDSGVTSGSSRGTIADDEDLPKHDHLSKTVEQIDTPSAPSMEVLGVGIDVARRPSTKIVNKVRLTQAAPKSKVKPVMAASSSAETIPLAPLLKPKVRPRKLSSKKPPDDLKAISEETSTDMADTMDSAVGRLVAAQRIQRAFRRHLQRRRDAGMEEEKTDSRVNDTGITEDMEISSDVTVTMDSAVGRVVAAQRIQRAFRRFMLRRRHERLGKGKPKIVVENAEISKVSSEEKSSAKTKSMDSAVGRVVAAQRIQRAYRRFRQRRRDVELEEEHLNSVEKNADVTEINSEEKSTVMVESMDKAASRIVAAQRIQRAFRRYMQRKLEIKINEETKALTEAVDSDLAEQEIAATNIQKHFRQHMQRRRREADFKEDWKYTTSQVISAQRIQRAYRQFIERRREHNEQVQAANIIQRVFRQNLKSKRIGAPPPNTDENSIGKVDKVATIHEPSDDAAATLLENANNSQQPTIDTIAAGRDVETNETDDTAPQLSIDQILNEPMNVVNIITIVSNSISAAGSNGNERRSTEVSGGSIETSALDSNDHVSSASGSRPADTDDDAVDIVDKLEVIEEPCVQKYVHNKCIDDEVDGAVETDKQNDEMKNIDTMTGDSDSPAIRISADEQDEIAADENIDAMTGDSDSPVNKTAADEQDVSDTSNTSTVIEVKIADRNIPEKTDVAESLNIFGHAVEPRSEEPSAAFKAAMLTNRRHTIVATIREDDADDTMDSEKSHAEKIETEGNNELVNEDLNASFDITNTDYGDKIGADLKIVPTEDQNKHEADQTVEPVTNKKDITENNKTDEQVATITELELPVEISNINDQDTKPLSKTDEFTETNILAPNGEPHLEPEQPTETEVHTDAKIATAIETVTDDVKSKAPVQATSCGTPRLNEIPYELLLGSDEQSDSTFASDDITLCSSTESASTTSRSGAETDVENLDLSAFGEDSLEAMYYTLRKNNIEVDKQQMDMKTEKDDKAGIETDESTDEPMKDDPISTVAQHIAHYESIESNGTTKSDDMQSSPDKTNDVIDNSGTISTPLVSEIDTIISDASKLVEQLTENVTEDRNDDKIESSEVPDDIQPGNDVASPDGKNDDVMTKESSTEKSDVDVADATTFDTSSFEIKDDNNLHPISDEHANEVIPSEPIADESARIAVQKMPRSVSFMDTTTTNTYADSFDSSASADHPTSNDPIAVAMHHRRALLDRMHGVGSTMDDTIPDRPDYRHTMWTSSMASETDSDINASGDQRALPLHRDDFNISTAIGHTSIDGCGSTSSEDTPTATTIVSAVTMIQANARGFLVRRRLRRSSGATTANTGDSQQTVQEQAERSSFGNAAITESLEAMVERQERIKMDMAARVIQRCLRARQRHRNDVIDNVDGCQAAQLDTVSSAKSMGRSSAVSADVVRSEVNDDNDEAHTIHADVGRDAETPTPAGEQHERAVPHRDVREAAKIATNDALQASAEMPSSTRQLSIVDAATHSDNDDAAAAEERLPVIVGHVLKPPATDANASAVSAQQRRLDSEEAHQQRRLTLQRGDAVQRHSTPDEAAEGGSSAAASPRSAGKVVAATVSDVGAVSTESTHEMMPAVTAVTLKPNSHSPRPRSFSRALGLRRNSMPVQIDSEWLRIIPKHLRKRIQSAGTTPSPTQRKSSR